jgi:S1-C subfamily serine protease
VAFIVCGYKLLMKNDREFEIFSVTGTGFVISDQGHLATNRHVVESVSKGRKAPRFPDAFQAEIEKIEPRVWAFIDGKRYEGSVTHLNPDYDFAVVKLPKTGDPIFTLSEAKAIPRGSPVFALGFPGIVQGALSVEEDVQRRILSSTFHKFVEKEFMPKDFEYLHTGGRVGRMLPIDNVDYVLHDAATHGGNSGGPLITEDGKVVGINTMSHNKAASANFALGLHQLRPVIESQQIPVVWK